MYLLCTCISLAAVVAIISHPPPESQTMDDRRQSGQKATRRGERTSSSAFAAAGDQSVHLKYLIRVYCTILSVANHLSHSPRVSSYSPSQPPPAAASLVMEWTQSTRGERNAMPLLLLPNK